ncbi:uncharacterized protein [Nicotiana tomentosiformis]|uniref:uncharacterized protein n=1 Tax=Nicotiana tomentosiformis TaxID=4098 RepID=UPI00388C92F9
MPKFEKYDGHGDPIAHLKRYCNQLRGAGGKKELLMDYFGESLTGIASEWYMDQNISHWHIWDDLAQDFVRQFQYNVDIDQDRNFLTNFKKKTVESFHEYAIKWREQAARVKLPMDETEMVNIFLQAQEADYFQNKMSAMGKPFAEAIKVGEMVENGLKTGRIISQSALRATSQAIQNSSGGLANRKKMEEGAMMASAIISIADSEAKPKAAAKQARNEKKITPIPQVAEKAVETNIGAAPAKDAILYIPRASRKHVLDIDTSYKFLLGRSWIHSAGAVPSTLHQMVKFEHENQEIVVHGEDEQSIYRDPSVPCLEAREGSEHIVYQAFEIVVADQCEEGASFPQPCLSNASVMVATEMIKHGYKPGKGLGVSLQGIIEIVTSIVNEKFFGVGFRDTEIDEKWADERKKIGWVLPQPIPHLAKSFVKPKYAEEEKEEAFTAEEIEDICEAMKQMLYESQMAQLGESTSTAEVLYMRPNAKLQNWKATPFPVRRESRSNNTDLNNMTCLRSSCTDPKTMSNCEIMNQELEYDEDEDFREINRELEQFENKPKPNLNETEPVIWSYDDMPGLSVDLVVHKLPTYPGYPPVQQKQRKFKTNISDKIKEEVTKQLKAGVIRVVRYTTWLANVFPVPKKDRKTRVCVDYRDLNKASPKDNFPFPNIHILVDNCAKHEIQSFVDCYAGYHQVLMDEEDAENMAFTTPWGTYCYRVVPFVLKNAGEIEVYVDEVIIKSRTHEDHVRDLRKFFEHLRSYNLKLNPAKCAFGVPSRKLLGFIVSRRGIELDPTKIKSIWDLLPPRTKKEVMSLLGRLNYISRFIAQLTTTCEPIFKLLKKDAAIKWTNECQEAFDKIKEYLSNPPVLVPLEPGRSLFLYLTVLENSFSYVLGNMM